MTSWGGAALGGNWDSRRGHLEAEYPPDCGHLGFLVGAIVIGKLAIPSFYG